MWYSPDNTHPAKAPADELPMQQQSKGSIEDGCQHLPKPIYMMKINVDVWLGGLLVCFSNSQVLLALKQ